MLRCRPLSKNWLNIYKIYCLKGLFYVSQPRLTVSSCQGVALRTGQLYSVQTKTNFFLSHQSSSGAIDSVDSAYCVKKTEALNSMWAFCDMVSRSLNFKVTKFDNFQVSSFKVPSFKVSSFQSSKFSKFQVSKFQVSSFQVSSSIITKFR